jgi:hypothetical protein
MANQMDNKPKLDRSKTGRARGTPNKVTGLLREAILMAAEQAGGKDGLVGYLRKAATECPTAFLGLLGRVLPLQVAEAADDGVLVVEIVKFHDKDGRITASPQAALPRPQ